MEKTMKNFLLALVTFAAFAAPHAAFADWNCGGVCDDVGDCVWFMEEPCYFDLWG